MYDWNASCRAAVEKFKTSFESVDVSLTLNGILPHIWAEMAGWERRYVDPAEQLRAVERARENPLWDVEEMPKPDDADECFVFRAKDSTKIGDSE